MTHPPSLQQGAAFEQALPTFWHAGGGGGGSPGASQVPPVQAREQHSLVVLQGAPAPRHVEHSFWKHVNLLAVLTQHLVAPQLSPSSAHGSQVPSTQRLLQQSRPLLQEAPADWHVLGFFVADVQSPSEHVALPTPPSTVVGWGADASVSVPPPPELHPAITAPTRPHSSNDDNALIR